MSTRLGTLCAATTVAILLALQSIEATTLVALRQHGRIIIGADSATTALRASKRSVSCKLFLGRSVAIAAGGLTRVDTPEGSPAYDLDDLARDVASTARSVREALGRLREATEPIAAGVPVAVKNTAPRQFTSLLLGSRNGREYGRFAGYLVAGIEGGRPAMARLLFDFSVAQGPVDLSKFAEVTVTQQVCPPSCPENGDPFVLGLDAGVRRAIPQSKERYPNDPTQVVEFLLRAQSALTPLDVSAPFVLAEVANGNVAWVAGHACHD